MQRDVLGICLSKSMLSSNLNSTFTHVRAYDSPEILDDAQVLESYPQLSGKEVLKSMKHSRSRVWRAEFCCQRMK
ncbi:hypothetical protein ACQEXU_06160 [Vibrio sp. TRT 21S02]|uniref:hypothetical protein n=1 Tax=unclassified Vibrio TaxID=2614977 RepID=UPI00349F99AF